MDRKLQWFGDDLQIDHSFGGHENHGDITFTATPMDEHFNLDLSRCTGRDRDIYDSSDDAEIDLNREEAAELLLLLTTWMEKQPR